MLIRGTRQASARLGSSSALTAQQALKEARRLWNGRLVLSPEVEDALESARPVVALESTIITHGMPHPTNLTTAQSLEDILRQKGVSPATIALFDGKIHVGLSDSQLDRLADTSSTEQKLKVSRRDIATALTGRIIGGTTVASTMYIAQSVGIPMFVTGGIGGVHRGAENSMDISADLIELGRTAMGVVCAGAKSILDIPRTLEVLETQGVCVATFGEQGDFPAFYTPSSGQKSPVSVADAYTAAELIGTGLSLPTPLSTLLAVPIPSEHAQAGDAVQQAVEQAVRESVEQGIDKRGKEVTPWLLARVGQLTSGSALNLNVKLIENNCRIGADIAVELARLRSEAPDAHASGRSYSSGSIDSSTLAADATPSSRSANLPTSRTSSRPSRPRVLVFGSAAMDLTSHSSLPLAPRTTTPGSIYLTPGGVGRNVAEAAHNLLEEGAVKLVSAIGADEDAKGGRCPDVVGGVLLREMEKSKMRTDGIFVVPGERSAACTLVLQGDMDLVNGVADMGVVEKVDSQRVQDTLRLDRPEMAVFDCNLLPEVIGSILSTSADLQIPTFCDPTSTPKLPRLASSLTALLPGDASFPRPLTHVAPNILELDLLYTLLASDELPSPAQQRSWDFVNSLNLGADARAKIEVFTNSSTTSWIRSEGIVQKAISCLPFVQSFWIKAGSKGLVYIGLSAQPIKTTSGERTKLSSIKLDREGPLTYLNLASFTASKVDPSELVSSTGAGDTASGSIVAGLIGRGSASTSEAAETATGAGEGGLDVDFVLTAMHRAERSIKSRRAVG